ncbi:MAG: hypothetical protein IH914_01630 [candidate division Zixibacteria bacterium]|nr:hypothetical protein [candidate division Zixibacteria bacterium]
MKTSTQAAERESMLNTKTSVSQIRHRLQLCSHLFDTTESFDLPARMIAGVVKRCPKNDSFEGVYEKTVLINTLYSTVVYDTLNMAKHIVSRNIDLKLMSADLSVIGDMRAGHGIGSNRGLNKEIDFYSFSTKYAAFHRPDIFPMFDDYVMRLLSRFNKSHQFTGKFSQRELRDYVHFKKTVDDFSGFVRMESLGYEKFDHALWLFGKYEFNPFTLDKTIKERIEQSRQEMSGEQAC